MSRPVRGDRPRGAPRTAFRAALGLIWLGWALLLAGSGLASDAAQTYVVELRDFFFDPPGLLLERGDRVVFVLAEDVLGDGHSATAFHPDFDKTLRVPEAAAPWNTGLLREYGASAEHVFRTTGVHDFYCIPHEAMGMVGRIVVEEATGPGSQPLSVGVSPAGRSVMPTADELFGPAGEAFRFAGRLNWVVYLWARAERARARAAWDALAVDPAALLPQMWGRLSPQDQGRLLDTLEAFGALLEEPDAAVGAIRRGADGIKLLLEQLAFALPSEGL